MQTIEYVQQFGSYPLTPKAIYDIMVSLSKGIVSPTKGAPMPKNAQSGGTEKRSISMYPGDWATVEEFAQERGYPSVSSAIRRIIHEWATPEQKPKQKPAHTPTVIARKVEPA
jgi:hypothetical protein